MGRTYRKRKRRDEKKEPASDQTNIVTLLKWLGIKTKLQLFDFSDTGRGLKTPMQIDQGDLLISIPLSKMITRFSKECCKYPTSWSTQLKLSAFLIEENGKAESCWRPYLNTLPQTYSVPYFDCPQNLIRLLPRHLNHLIQSQFDLVEKEYLNLTAVIADVKLSAFAWAWFTANTRGVYFCDGHDNLALAPFLDMFNHSPLVQVQALTTDKYYNLQSIDRGWPSHSQVFINYGPHDNVKLYVEYGFVIPDNPNDSFSFVLEDLLDLKDFAHDETLRCAKIEFIKKNQLDSKLQIVANDPDPISWSILACLHVLNIDCKVYDQDLVVNDANRNDLIALIQNAIDKIKRAQKSTRELQVLSSLLETQLEICETVLGNLC